jgi:hypothetical protein
MTRPLIYLVMICLFGLTSCNSEQKGDKTTTAQPSVEPQKKTGDEPMVISEQSEADTPQQSGGESSGVDWFPSIMFGSQAHTRQLPLSLAKR